MARLTRKSNTAQTREAIAARNRINISIRDPQKYVSMIARRVAPVPPPLVDYQDLIQAGLCGLLEAEKNYESARGASFATYAYIRIRGEILDEIRKYHRMPIQFAVRLETMREDQDPRDPQKTPDESLEELDINNYLADQVELLPDHQRQVVKLLYWEGLSLTKIGALLGITAAGVSYHRSNAIKILRDCIGF